MNVVGIIIFSLLAVFVTWLVIDTTIYVVKKVKEKKAKKKQQEVNNATDTK